MKTNNIKSEGIKILDCTIRDGGYLNNWEFSDTQVISCFDAASKSGFDFVELGFRSSKKIFKDKKYGKWFFCSENDLRMVYQSVENPAKISVMIRPENIELDNFLPSEDSVIQMVRVVVTDPSYVSKACKYVDKLKRLGYIVGLNPIRIDIYNDFELRDYIRSIANYKLGLDYFFFADNYGSIDLNKFSKLMIIFNDEYFSIEDYPTKLGLHSHNNLQDAILKSLSAIEMGFSIIDSCMFGLGRGPGNLCSELLINELQKIDSYKYNVLPSLEFINEHIHHYKNNTNNKLDCRYNLLYVMTGILTIHPDYGEYFLRNKTIFPIRKIWKIFHELIKLEKHKSFDKNYLETHIL